jgi:muconate cycloisomerase
LKIASIEAIAIDLPMRRPMKMAGMVIHQAENVVVKITSSCGIVGWGESASAPTMTGETVQGICAAVDFLAERLLGAELDLSRLTQQMKSWLYGNTSAKAAIDMAAHDLVGRKLNKPVHALLGHAVRDSVQVLWLLGTGSKASDLLEAQTKYDEGLRAFKIKVGIDPVELDIDRALAVRELLPPDAWLCADANQGWQVEEACQFVRAAGSSLMFLEQPLHAEDLLGMSQVSTASKTPIGIDEGVHKLSDLTDHHHAKAASGCSLKTIKLGSLNEVLHAGGWCAQNSWGVNLACKIAESGISTAAVLHLGAVLPTLNWGVSLSNQYLADDVISDTLEIRDGRALIPSGPGLGITVDEARIRHFQRKLY